jgi:hypothetical protein
MVEWQCCELHYLAVSAAGHAVVHVTGFLLLCEYFATVNSSTVFLAAVAEQPVGRSQSR